MYVSTLLLILVIAQLMLPTISQPFDVFSYPSSNQLVPIPGDFFIADAPPPPTTQSSAAAASASSVVRSAESDAAACVTGWCSKPGQWLPTNITYILMAIACLVLLFGLRDDRKTCAILVTWFASIYVLYLINYTIAWYLAVGANFLVYHIVSSWENKIQTDEDDIVEQIEEEEDMNELMNPINQMIDPTLNDAQMLEKMDAVEKAQQDDDGMVHSINQSSIEQSNNLSPSDKSIVN